MSRGVGKRGGGALRSGSKLVGGQKLTSKSIMDDTVKPFSPLTFFQYFASKRLPPSSICREPPRIPTPQTNHHPVKQPHHTAPVQLCTGRRPAPRSVPDTAPNKGSPAMITPRKRRNRHRNRGSGKLRSSFGPGYGGGVLNKGLFFTTRVLEIPQDQQAVCFVELGKPILASNLLPRPGLPAGLSRRDCLPPPHPFRPPANSS